LPTVGAVECVQYIAPEASRFAVALRSYPSVGGGRVEGEKIGMPKIFKRGQWSIGLLVALLLAPVRAQQSTPITLSCSGTDKLITTDDAPTSVVNVGLVVDFAGRAVTFASHHIPITSVDSTRVVFQGVEATNLSGNHPKRVTIFGSMDRVTGRTEIMFLYQPPMIDMVFRDAVWEMVCRPANQQF
jgi:hypothetical protein